MSNNKSSYSLFSDNKTNDTDVLDEICPKLSYKQRLYGFGICSGIGWLISFLSFITFFQGNYGAFAIMFTCGNLIAVCGTCFLSGPKDQYKKMTDKKRLACTIIFFCSMIFTIICAVVIKIGALTILSALIQFAAFFWYSLSFIPFGQQMLTKCAESLCA